MKIKFIFFILYSSFLFAQTIPLYFEGNENISDTNLYKALSLEKPSFYEFWKKDPSIDLKTISLLTQTTENYYKTKGYFNTNVTHTNNDTYITIIIKENDPVRISDLTVISKLDIKKKIPFKVGDIFDAQAFTKSKKDIKLLYTDKSYCNVEINAKSWIDIKSNLAYISYDITENKLCYVGKISITPSENIDTNIIKSLLYFREKRLFSTQDLSDSYSNLYGYEGISKAIINTQIDNNNTVNINVQVTQNEKPIRLETGLGASSDEGLVASLRLKHRNIFGNLKTVSLETKLTQIKQTVKTNFDMPLTHRNATGAELGYENELFSGFKESRVFASVYLKHRKLPHLLKESILLDNTNTYSSNDLELFPEGNLMIISPKIEWSYDTRDKILNPKSGYFVNAELMGSVLSEVSDASYYKLELTVGYILPIANSVIALKSKFGTLNLFDGNIPASYKFFAGGMNSNRAYSYNKLGPTNSLGDPLGFDSIFETTLEYRFPLYSNIRGLIFSDNTFIGSDDIPTNNNYHSAGIGIGYMTPIGPLAFDFGFDISNPSENYAFHFRVGELF